MVQNSDEVVEVKRLMYFFDVANIVLKLANMMQTWCKYVSNVVQTWWQSGPSICKCGANMVMTCC